MKPLLRFTPIALLTAAIVSPAANAQLISYPDISLTVANRLADAAVAACLTKGRHIAVSVVDRGGNLVALQRADNVGPHNTEASRRKAYTALSTKSNTLMFSESARENPDSRNLTTLPDLLLLGGGQPLKVGQQLVGAIGVAGGGGAQQDQACAIAAITAVPELNQMSN